MIPRAFIVCGLGYGDESKGSMTDYLARRYGASLVVRANGGCQAAHNVVLQDGRHHTFSQLGSASFTGAHTHLSRFMLIEPGALFNEIQVFSKTSGRSEEDIERTITIDPRCPVVTHFHWTLNRDKEKARGNAKHGSCGLGIGECRRFQVEGRPMLYAGDLRNEPAIFDKLCAIREVFEVEAAELHRRVSDKELALYAQVLCDIAKTYRFVDDEEIQLRLRNRVTIFEGAQGVLIDQDWGFAPYNTWTNCTTENARELIGDAVPITAIGVLRSYSTRHGPGPFVSENGEISTEKHNGTHEWQGRFRIGYFDEVATRYAIKHAGGIDQIALTHMDAVGDSISSVERYRTTMGDLVEIDGLATMDLMCAAPIIQKRVVGTGGALNIYERLIEKPIRYVSYGPTAEDKKEIP